MARLFGALNPNVISKNTIYVALTLQLEIMFLPYRCLTPWLVSPAVLQSHCYA